MSVDQATRWALPSVTEPRASVDQAIGDQASDGEPRAVFGNTLDGWASASIVPPPATLDWLLARLAPPLVSHANPWLSAFIQSGPKIFFTNHHKFYWKIPNAAPSLMFIKSGFSNGFFFSWVLLLIASTSGRSKYFYFERADIAV